MRRVVLTLCLLWIGLLCWQPVVQAGPQPYAPGDVLLAELPPQARDTWQLIQRGGPFPYARDGVVFGNYERVLPPQPRGYYHEYTVPTPGVRHRGARRIVCGIVPARVRPMGSPLLRSDPFALPECYYSADHYRTFRRIRE